ncbi:MAG: RNA polymerase-associated protein RapA, partial [Gammaproteobacteria bacterium]
MSRIPFKPGQRWISDAERELGLGEILEADERIVSVAFPAAGLQRQYAVNRAPLTRIIFSRDDVIQDSDGHSLVVLDVINNDDILLYQCHDDQGEQIALPESRLSSAMQFGRPQDRLFAGAVDPEKWFRLRHQTLAIKSRLQQSPVQGLIGARVELIPHQLYIASEVGKRHAPRVLLADEVGLGKTIEAGLILHRQLLSGQISRVLILLPEALVHQWLVEMLRRFNLKFSIFDEQRCLETAETNPFETSQLVIASLDFFMHSEERRQQALEAGWDMLVVDEAHHLHWSEQAPGAEYRFVEQLASATPGLLLLTATPEQLGVSSHFARLRLLDPARFHSLEAFLEEEKNYEPVARAASALIDHELLSNQQTAWLLKALPDYRSAIEHLGDDQVDAASRGQIIQALLDRYGAGRVLFRNTRDAIRGFPERQLRLARLESPAQYADCRRGVSALKPELSWRKTGTPESWTEFDPRVAWLTDLIQTNPEKKFLVICAEANTSIELEQELRVRQAIRSAAFHEGLNMVARDRAAAWFADAEENAQCLICSEIGSEGRNFQFCHHLVLFD